MRARGAERLTRRLSSARIAACALGIAGLSRAADAAPPIRFAIAPGPAEAALERFGRQADRQILFTPEAVAGCVTASLVGTMAPEHAIRRLLRPCRVDVRALADGTLLIERARTRPVPAPAPADDIAPDIVVTALKRETPLAATAVGMSALRGTDLAAHGILDLRAFGRSTPSLSVLDTGTGQQRLTVRGIYATGEPTVGVYYNETPVSGPAGTTFDAGFGAPDLELVDVDRIELLRGPQGTLYGASSMGGTLRILFGKPAMADWSGEAGAGIEAMAHGGLGGSASAVVNAPLAADRLALRAVLYGRTTGGYIANRTTGRNDGGRIVRVGGRLALGWVPAWGMEVLATTALQRLRAADAGAWFASAGRYRTTQPVVTPYTSRLGLADLTVRLDRGGPSLVATLSRYVWRQDRNGDYTAVLAGQRASDAGCRRFTAAAADRPCATAELAAYAAYVDSRLPAILHQPLRAIGTSGEIRLASPRGQPLAWTGGVFFSRRVDRVDSYAIRADAATGVAIAPLDITGYRRVETSLLQTALFGEVSWQALADLTATAGGRLFQYRSMATGSVVVPNIITGTADLDAGPNRTHQTGSNAKIGLAWRARPGLLVYAQAAQGFRPGGVNITPGLTTAERSYAADHLWSYELGAKLRSPDGRLTLDLAAYHVDWSNMISSIASGNGAFVYNTNIGPVGVDGGEIALAASPRRQWRIDLQASLTNARLAQDQVVPSSAGKARRGDRLPNISPVAASVAVSRSWTIGHRAGLTLTGQADYAAGFASQFNPAMSYYERTPAHLLASTTLGLTRDACLLSLAVSNLLGSVTPLRIVTDATGLRRIYSATPRTVRISLVRRFGGR